MLEALRHNLLSPLPLAFALGFLARAAKSDLAMPKGLYDALSVYLLLALGLKGGVELAETPLASIALPAALTLLLGILTPLIAFMALRRRFGVADSAGIAAHYGSVSAVTFVAAGQFVTSAGYPAEGFMPTLLTLLESPGIHVALALGAVGTSRVAAVSRSANGAGGGTMTLSHGGPPGNGEEGASSAGEVAASLREVLTGKSMVLLVGGLLIGYLSGKEGYAPVRPFFEGGFKGALTLFLLDLGLTAGAHVKDVRKVGVFLGAFAIVIPVLHGALGVLAGRLAGLSIGGCTVLGAMAASASYIAAPPAVRAKLPDANPTYSITAALAVTFPFNLSAGIPLYFYLAKLVA